MRAARFGAVLAASVLGLLRPAGAIDLLQVDEAKIRREIWDPSVAKQTTNYAGTVFLDGKGLAGARVTDGIQFVVTDTNGHYQIGIRFDAMTPLLQARVISVCWPEGTWPEKHPVNGRLRFWRRVGDDDVKSKPDAVDFFLTKRVIEPPFIVAFGADEHGNFWDYWGYTMPQEIARASTPVHLGMHLGDLTYADFPGAPKIYAHFEKYAREFPTSFLHLFGNHDVVPGPPDHELVGYGAFHKFLNPKRMSFDAAGIHVLLLDYWFINQQTVDWVDVDLGAVPKDRPVYIFTHSWGGYFDGLCERHPNIRLIQGGHSHKTQFYGRVVNADLWSFYTFYRTLFIDGDDYEFMDRDRGGNPIYSFYKHGLGRGGRVSRVSGVKLSDAAKPMPAYVTPTNAPANAAAPTNDTYDVTFTGEATGGKPAERFGVRVIAESGEVVPFCYDSKTKTVNMAGRVTYYDPVPVQACMKTVQPEPPVWQARLDEDAYLKLLPEEQARPEEKAKYADALAKLNGWKQTQMKVYESWLASNPPPRAVRMDVNICPGRIQVFINNQTAYIQFMRVGPAARIEYFAEGGEATFAEVAAFETGAGYIARGYDRPPRTTRLR